MQTPLYGFNKDKKKYVLPSFDLVWTQESKRFIHITPFHMNKRFNDVKKAKTRDRSNNEDVAFLKKNYKWEYVVLISVFIQYISVIEINSVSTWKTVYTEFHIFFYKDF